MALKFVDGKEVRVPGGAIPVAQRRKGALGRMDGLRLSEFRKIPLADRHNLFLEARGSKLLESERIVGAKSQAAALRFLDSAMDVAKETTSWSERCSEFCDIAAALAKAGMFDKAMKVAERIPLGDDAYWRSKAFHSIVTALVKAGRFDEAMKVANSMSYTVMNSLDQRKARCKSFCGIATAMSQAGEDPSAALDSAMKAAEKCWDSPGYHMTRSNALVDISTALSQAGRCDEATKVADSITDNYCRHMAFFSIATVLSQAGKDPVAALDSAMKAAERMRNAEYFLSIAIALARTGEDPTQAFNSALKSSVRITDNTERSKAFCKIATEMVLASISKV